MSVGDNTLAAAAPKMPNWRDHQNQTQAATGMPVRLAASALPEPPLLGFDEVWDLSLAGGQYNLGGAQARVNLDRFAWAFDCHFVGDPVFPGALMLDALLQLTGLCGAMRGFVGRGRAARAQKLRFLSEVTPDSGSIEYQVVVRQVSKARQIIIADGQAMSGGRSCLKVTGLVVLTLAAA